ncbi:hypothetical protein PISMIDRAFT_676727 [Pisolithus microcarpus 441]|uniref:Uncharacterized protein n=1 Tax=Pisolithus microcarpus 441 TaxID=765257 RepID=A0A0C9ZU71_9AGAM|nr:hypothetical protein PISMIDRAFT_676727 [Pisolithus microcarpus 441]
MRSAIQLHTHNKRVKDELSRECVRCLKYGTQVRYIGQSATVPVPTYSQGLEACHCPLPY